MLGVLALGRGSISMKSSSPPPFTWYTAGDYLYITCTIQATVHVIHRRNQDGNALAGNGLFKNFSFCLVKPRTKIEPRIATP